MPPSLPFNPHLYLLRSLFVHIATRNAKKKQTRPSTKGRERTRPSANYGNERKVVEVRKAIGVGGECIPFSNFTGTNQSINPRLKNIPFPSPSLLLVLSLLIYAPLVLGPLPGPCHPFLHPDHAIHPLLLSSCLCCWKSYPSTRPPPRP